MFFRPSANPEEASSKEKKCSVALCVDLNIWSESICAHTSMSSLQINV